MKFSFEGEPHELAQLLRGLMTGQQHSDAELVGMLHRPGMALEPAVDQVWHVMVGDHVVCGLDELTDTVEMFDEMPSLEEFRAWHAAVATKGDAACFRCYELVHRECVKPHPPEPPVWREDGDHVHHARYAAGEMLDGTEAFARPSALGVGEKRFDELFRALFDAEPYQRQNLVRFMFADQAVVDAIREAGGVLELAQALDYAFELSDEVADRFAQPGAGRPTLANIVSLVYTLANLDALLPADLKVAALPTLTRKQMDDPEVTGR